MLGAWGSSPVLLGRRGEIPPRYSTLAGALNDYILTPRLSITRYCGPRVHSSSTEKTFLTKRLVCQEICEKMQYNLREFCGIIFFSIEVSGECTIGEELP